GVVVTALGVKVDPEADVVEVDGRVVRPQQRLRYLALNKPRGYVTTVHDPQGRPTVMDLLAGVTERVFPVGRLDMDSEGLLLLTNDGELAYRLTHPKYMVPKTYLVTAVGEPSPEALDQLRTGIALEDGITSPAEVRRYSPADPSWLTQAPPGIPTGLSLFTKGASDRCAGCSMHLGTLSRGSSGPGLALCPSEALHPGHTGISAEKKCD